MTDDGPDEEARRRAERALDRLEERVQDVRHLHPFEMSRREDGRFRCELKKPLSELTRRERLATAEALEEMARLLRRAAET